MPGSWSRVRDRVAKRTDRIVSALQDEWDTDRTAEPFALGPRAFDPDEPPGTAVAQLERVAGIASVVVFYTDAYEETVLVYNPGGFWEPPEASSSAIRRRPRPPGRKRAKRSASMSN